VLSALLENPACDPRVIWAYQFENWRIAWRFGHASWYCTTYPCRGDWHVTMLHTHVGHFHTHLKGFCSTTCTTDYEQRSIVVISPNDAHLWCASFYCKQFHLHFATRKYEAQQLIGVEDAERAVRVTCTWKWTRQHDASIKIFSSRSRTLLGMVSFRVANGPNFEARTLHEPEFTSPVRHLILKSKRQIFRVSQDIHNCAGYHKT